MTTREQIVAAAREAGAVLFESQGELIVHLGATRVPDMIEHLYAIAFEAGRKSVDTPVALAEAYRCGEEAGRVAEREECLTALGKVMVTDHSLRTYNRCLDAIRARGDTK